MPLECDPSGGQVPAPALPARRTRRCLRLPVNEWEERFLNNLIHGTDETDGPPQQLSARRMEKLFEIRDKYELHATMYGGFFIPNLIRRVFEARRDLDEGDEEWITALRGSGVDKLRRADIGRLRRCAVQIGEIKSYMDDA